MRRLGKHGGWVALRGSRDGGRIRAGPVGRHLEDGTDMGRSNQVGIEVLPGHEVLEALESEPWIPKLKQGFALGQLMLNMLGVATGGEGLTMPVLLVAYCASGGTGGASRVL